MSIEPIEYIEDPDFVLTVDVIDEATGRSMPVEVGYGYKDGKRGTLHYLNTDPYSRQLLQEATTMRANWFKRDKVEGNRCPDATPRPSYRPTASPTR